MAHFTASLRLKKTEKARGKVVSDETFITPIIYAFHISL